METRYPVSRFIVTLPGLGVGILILYTLGHYLCGPSSSYVTTDLWGFSWRDSNPFLSFLNAMLWQCAALGGTFLMWIRPRAGYFCAGMGYLLYLTQFLVEFYASPWIDRSLDASGWMLRLFALPVWLFWLCVKDEPGGTFFTPPGGGRRGTPS
jgi:hypothetical protein